MKNIGEGVFWESDCLEAESNLALEEYLLYKCMEIKRPILLLWQNRNAVVIGRNQNAFIECNMEYAHREGIHIVRRLTGGGAVYHDLGNINYSFILPKELYDKDETMQLVVDALKMLGVSAKKTGRNDICIKGEKVSGNAYFSKEYVALHHGTILYEVNKNTLSNVLQVTDAKLSKNGIKSIKARVTDIKSKYPKILLSEIKESIKSAFKSRYGLTSMRPEFIDDKKLQPLIRKYSSIEWNINKISDYSLVDFYDIDGELIHLSMEIDGERLTHIEISSDSMRCEIIEEVRKIVNRYLDNNDVCDIDRLKMLFVSNKEAFEVFDIKNAMLDLFNRKHN